MDQETALLAAIAAHPEEDTPRLAYADWLDEHAADLPEPASARVRAEFIRVQCEIQRLEGLTRPEQNRYIELYRRQDAILTDHRRDLLGPLGDELSEAEMHRDVRFDRGFVMELELSAERFARHAEAVARIKPLPVITVRNAAVSINHLAEVSPHLEIVSALHMQSDRGPEPIMLTPAEVWSIFVECWPWDRLRELNLEGCRIGDEGLERLAAGDGLGNLTHLDLSGNEISDDGVRLLVASPMWPRLKSLVLGANPISNEGVNALADGAASSQLEYLNLKFTGITSEGHRVLLRRFPRRTKLDLF
jgi:uncharacterized protein (TIGR02996 family)